MDAGTLISELKRRRVFRVLVGYGLVAFAVLQIIEPVMHALHLADVTLTYTVLALALGFPIVVVLAWAFDVNEGRLERTAPTSGPLTGKRLKLVLIGIGIVAATPVVIWYFVWPGHRTSRVETPSTSVQPSIAVLPFADMSPGRDQEYFSDGIAEEILNALTQVEGLHVAGRTSSFSFKRKDVKLADIGRELGVATALEGSVRKAGNRMRITAQLVTTSDGFHLWSRTFDRDLTDIFAVQEEIAREVVTALKLKLLPGKAPSTKSMRTSNPEAHNYNLLGREFLRRGTTDDWRRALTAFQKALALDPEYAPSWAGASIANFLLEEYDPVDPEFRQRAQAAADRAIALAPELADGYRARGLIRRNFSFDWTGAQADFERALALNPGDAPTTVSHAYMLAVLGRVPEAIAAARKATEIDPLDANTWAALGAQYNRNNEFDRALTALNRALEISPEYEVAMWPLGANLMATGRANDALALAKRSHHDWFRLTFTALAEYDLGNVEESQAALDTLIALKFSPSVPDAAYLIAWVYAWRGERDRAFEWLERAYVQRDTAFPGFQNDPLLRKLHNDPRWKPFLKKMNVPMN